MTTWDKFVLGGWLSFIVAAFCLYAAIGYIMKNKWGLAVFEITLFLINASVGLWVRHQTKLRG